MTPAQLQRATRAQQKVLHAQQEVVKVTARRDAVVCELRSEGCTLDEVGAAMGLTIARISQITRAAAPAAPSAAAS